MMRLGLRQLVGTHDFRNFCKMNVVAVYNFVRTIHSARLVVEGEDGERDGEICYFEIVGQAFLWHQIRCIVSVLFLIGRGLESPDVVGELLNVDKYPGKPAYNLADASPLVLHECAYSNLRFGYTCQNLWNVHCQQEAQWEESALVTARIRNAMESVKDDATVSVVDLLDFVHTKKKGWRNKKGDSTSSTTSEQDGSVDADCPFRGEEYVTWRDALAWIRDQVGLVPHPDGGKKECPHKPLLQRSKGTTYEEKVAAVQQSGSTKRRQRYEDNVVRKRKTKEEDAAFYKHKLSQGAV